MIYAAKQKWFDRLFLWYNEMYLLRRHFHAIEIEGVLDESTVQHLPHVYYVNHSSWWDGLIVYQAFRHLSSADHYIMMGQQQLQKYMFFRKIGAYGIDATHVQGIKSSLTYTIQLLKQNKRVWLFPQGEIVHLNRRPLQFRPGIDLLLRSVPHTVVVPVALHHGLYQHQKLQVLLQIGKPLRESWDDYSRREIAPYLTCVLERQLDDLATQVVSSIDGTLPHTVSLIKRQHSINETYDRWRKRGRRKQ